MKFYKKSLISSYLLLCGLLIIGRAWASSEAGASDRYLVLKETDPIASFETYLPHKTQPVISKAEKLLLTQYLQNPRNSAYIKALAIYHFEISQLVGGGSQNGKRIKHAILASYFFNRLKDVGVKDPLLQLFSNQNDELLKKQLSYKGVPVADDDVPHEYFIDAFNYHEENRYEAIDQLLQEVGYRPGNALTNAYLTASNIWVGGEANYDDPTLLYNFVLSSYFSVRTVAMAQEMELAWKKDPVKYQRFRLAPILGGWTVPARRWLARFHDDKPAVALLDAEHRKWLALNRAFHSASVGLMLFSENENFPEAYAAMESGNQHCSEIPELRSCGSEPRFSFNNIAFFGSAVDYYLKNGQLDYAQFFLSFWKTFQPFAYDKWTLGRPAWEHREQNLVQIYEHYHNNDPTDDPVNMLLKRHKWGPDAITCQLCHQAQDRVWTEEEKSHVSLPHESVATIGNWPVVSTSWYGAVKKL